MRHFAVLLAFCASPCAAHAAEKTGKPWLDMDYGPFLSASIEAPFPENNIACKGIAIRLKSQDGASQAAALFDTDLLRFAAAWTGGFVDLKGVVYDGEHWAYPKIQGAQSFGTRSEPGWARAGSFHDPRSPPYGPLPRGWARWRGLYKYGDRVVLSYSVDSAQVLELPGLEHDGEVVAFSRTMEIGPTDADLQLEVFFAGRQLEISSSGSLIVARGPQTTAAAVVGQRDGVRWLEMTDGHARLEIKASTKSRNLKLLVFGGREMDLAAFSRLSASSGSPEALAPLTRGGPSRWPERVVTQGTQGTSDGPYAIDWITPPDENPWNAWMRFGGMDWLDPGRAALSTWSGDVWVVSGIGPELERLEWRRIAAGLYQPLGLKLRDGEIFVVGRDQITRLRDLNGDGETDFYECFNNDAQNTEHFHEFAMDLETDAEGNFYYMKGARHARDSVVPQHGTLLKVSRDGASTEILSNGFRAPNGLCVSPSGEFFSTDQQGHWIPANRINLLHRGSFGGNMWSYHLGERPATYDPPLCWIHPTVDRSPSTILQVDSGQWGPVSGQLLSVSYGMGQLFLVPFERVNGMAQGGVVKLPLEFDTGICRGRFHPVDGQLYTCGLFGWAGNKTRPGGFFRVRYTGKPLNLPLAFHAFEGGLEIGFSDALDPVEARNPGSYGVQCWNYRWTENYGSPDVRFDGKEGRETLAVTDVELAADGKVVRLAIPALRPVMQINIDFHLKAATGEPIRTALHATIHALGKNSNAARPARAPQPLTLGSETRAQGLMQILRRNAQIGPGQEDARQVRCAALYVPAGAPPSPFLDPGLFRSEWRGFLKLDINETFTFEARGRGSLELSIGGKTVLAARGERLEAERSSPVQLQQGLNELRMVYESPGSGDAWVRLYWQRADSAPEPIPPAAFEHETDNTLLRKRLEERQGREILARRLCLRCHLPDSQLGRAAMPDLAAEGPSLAGVGSRLNTDWIASWILEPRAVRSDARMPRMLHGSAADRSRDARDLAAFLSTLIDASKPAPAPRPVPADEAQRGTAHWAALGCFACHELPLPGASGKWRSDALAEYLQAPAKHFAWTRMPDFKLSSDEASALARCILDRDQGSGAVAPQIGGNGDPARGRELANSLRCAACHEIPGLKRPDAAPWFSRLPGSDPGCLAESITRLGVPDFALGAGQRSQVRDFLRDGLESLGREDEAELAERQILELRCTACHERDGSSDPWLERAGATAAEVDPTQPGTIHRMRPPLTWAGEKLRPEWTKRLLGGELGYRTRPRATARMPAFPALAPSISRGLALQHGFAPTSPDRGQVDRELATIGHALTQPTALVCVQCHPVGGKPALAGADTETIDFIHVSDRLTEHFFYRFLADPGSLQSGTMMPRYTTSDGKSVVRGVFDGNAAKQFEAIWHYLRSLEPRPR